MKGGMVFETEWQAGAIYRLFLHVAPGDICPVQVVCFLWRCCLRNSTEVVLVRVSPGTVPNVDISESCVFLSPENIEV